MYRNLNLLDTPFLARLGSGGSPFVCADYTPGQATNLLTPYGGTAFINGQGDVDALAGFDGIDGGLAINCDTSLLTDVGPLNALLEITGAFDVFNTCDPSFIPMTGLRWVGGAVGLAVSPSVTDVNNFCFNLTRTGGAVTISGGDALTSLGTGFMRHLFFADPLRFSLALTASVSLNGLFPCFTGSGVEFT